LNIIIKSSYGISSRSFHHVFDKKTSVQLLDTTARDAHQSLVNSQGIDVSFGQLSAKHVVRLHHTSLQNGGAGFRGFESGGGMTPDACARTLGINYWWWLNQVAKELPKDLPIQILLRSQSANGYRPFSDDVVRANIEQHMNATNGHPIRGRVFDALNSPMNSVSTYQAAQAFGMETEGMYCYNPSLTGDLDTQNAVTLIQAHIAMGADAVGVKDMAGLMPPQHAYDLALAIRSAIGPDINLSCHTHMTSHMAPATYYAFILGNIAAGGGPVSIDGSISSFSGGPGQPSLETLAMMLKTMDSIQGPALDTHHFSEYDQAIDREIAHLKPMITKTARIGADPRVMISKSPGGAYGNLVAQLEKANLTNLLPFILDRIPYVKSALGNIPLVTPTALHVTTQAAKDVLGHHANALKGDLAVSSNDYINYLHKMTHSPIESMTIDTKNIVMGLYGQSPEPIDAELKKRVIYEAIFEIVQSDISGLNTTDKDDVMAALVRMVLEMAQYAQSNQLDRDTYLQLKKGTLDAQTVQFIAQKIPAFDGVDHWLKKGVFSDQKLPQIIQQAMPVVGRSGDILDPELATVRSSLKKAQDALGFSMPWGTLDQIALTATMFGGSDTAYPGITSVGLDFLKNQGDSRHFPNSAKELKQWHANGGAVNADKKDPIASTTNQVASTKGGETKGHYTVKCTMPGQFYSKPSPSEPPYVTNGDYVEEGQTIGLTSAMKLATPITASKSGYIKILVEDETQVSIDQPLFMITDTKEALSS